MNIFLTTLESVALLLGIGLLGFLLVQRKILPEKALSALSPLALEIALPSLIFTNIITEFTPSEYADWWQLPLWWMIFTVIIASLTGVFSLATKKTVRQEFALALFYQNGIFFPLAILSGIFGSDSFQLTSLFIFTLVYPAFFFNTYPLFFGQSIKKLKWKKILHPVLIVTIIAIALRLTGAYSYIPMIVTDVTQMLGALTIPLIMILLGGNIYLDYKKKGTQLFTGEIIKFVLVKNIVFPLLFLGIVLVLRPPFIVALLLMIQSMVPPLTAGPLVTERAGGNRALVNQFLVASFLTSLVSIPAMIFLFSLYFPF